MGKKEELLIKYNRTDQKTKQEIVKYLWDNPDQEHRPNEIFDAIKDLCNAGTVETVANNLSDLATAKEILHERRSFYQWTGEGNPDPKKRFQVVEHSVKKWVESLVTSRYAFFIFFGLAAIGILTGIISLIFLFLPRESLIGLEFIHIFFFTGLMTTLASAALLIWAFIYYFEIRFR